jgi:hypothetical protein
MREGTWNPPNIVVAVQHGFDVLKAFAIQHGQV